MTIVSSSARRLEARARFTALGVPDRHLEAWKYTSTRAAVDTPWVETSTARPVAGSPTLTPELPGLPTDLGFVNGLPVSRGVGRGRSGAEASAAELDALGGLVDLSQPHAGLWALNGAEHDAFATFDVPAENVLPGAFVLHWHTEGAEPLRDHPRTLIRVGANARVVIVERFTAQGRAWVNPVTELVLGPGAQVEYVRLQAQGADTVHTSAVFARLDRDATLVTHEYACGAALTRAEVHVQLAGPGATCRLNGLYVLDGKRHADLYTRIRHEAPHTTSEELYKGVLRGNARGVFTGNIYMGPGVRGASTRQENPNLLLGDGAHVDTRPQLEILHNDVKAFHGATIGRLDPGAIFYLRSRGLSTEAARLLLTGAFCNTVLDTLPLEALRTHLDAWLAGALTEDVPS